MTFVVAVLPWVFAVGHPLTKLLASVVMSALFIWSVRRNRHWRAEREFAEQQSTVLQESLRRCGGDVVLIRDWRRPDDPTEKAETLSPILDPGQTWSLTDQERDDLDLYSPPVGVFGLLNRTCTLIGARRLRDHLDRPCLESERILARQAAVQWLKKHPKERLQLMGALTSLRGDDRWLYKLLIALRRASPLPDSILPGVLRVWGVVSGLFSLVAVSLVVLGGYGWINAIIVLAVLNGTLYFRMRRELDCRLGPWRNLVPALSGFLLVSREAARDLPVETQLQELRECFAPLVRDKVLASLRSRVGWADSGGMIHALCNLLFFYDLHVIQSILRRALPYRDELIRGSVTD